MAKEKVNKSQLVRDLLASDPKMTVADIVKTLGEKGVKVQPSLIYAIKAKMSVGKKRAARKKLGGSVPLEVISGLKALADQVGGMAALKVVVDAMA